MMDDLIDQQVSFTVMNHLVNCDHESASWIRGYLEGLNMWIEDCPLPGPVIAHAFMSIDEAAFHSIRPDHVGLHAGKNRVEPASIEVTVSAP